MQRGHRPGQGLPDSVELAAAMPNALALLFARTANPPSIIAVLETEFITRSAECMDRLSSDRLMDPST
jgi:hypothetical protein